jgi:hypothetical protein
MSNVSLTFPDGSVRDYDAATTGAALAESISKSLAKKAVAYTLDGELRDLSDPLKTSGAIEIVTRSDPARWNSFGTTRPTFWRKPCRSYGPERRSPSAR